MSKTFEQPLANQRAWKELQAEKKAYLIRKQNDKDSIKAMLDYLEHKDWYDNTYYKDFD